MRHNKKRNAAIIYEQLVRFISKSLVDGKMEQAKQAMSIVQEHFKPGTHLHKEFKLFNALVRTTVDSESIALRILDEAKKAVQKHDSDSLDKEKGLLIRSINRKLSHPMFFEQRIPDYRSLATVQTLLNDWRNINPDNIQRIAEYETKVLKLLIEKKENPALEISGQVSNLSLNIMKKKFSEKMSSELNENQLRIIKLSLTGDKQKLVPLLEEIKTSSLRSLNEFEKRNKNSILLEKVSGVRDQLNNLSTEDLHEDDLSKFLLLNNLVEEFNGEKDVE